MDWFIRPLPSQNLYNVAPMLLTCFVLCSLVLHALRSLECRARLLQKVIVTEAGWMISGHLLVLDRVGRLSVRAMCTLHPHAEYCLWQLQHSLQVLGSIVNARKAILHHDDPM